MARQCSHPAEGSISANCSRKRLSERPAAFKVGLIVCFPDLKMDIPSAFFCNRVSISVFNYISESDRHVFCVDALSSICK